MIIFLLKSLSTCNDILRSTSEGANYITFLKNYLIKYAKTA